MRILLVPVIIWALITGAAHLAFILFLVAGVSDAVDGAVARLFNQQSAFGTVLDPIADKMLLVSVFIVLGFLGHIPIWLAILVVSRDVIIIAGVLLAFVMARPVTIKPLWVSKANTAAQIMLAAFTLGLLTFGLSAPILKSSMEIATGMLTGASAIAYIVQGLALFANGDSASTQQTDKDENARSD